MDPLQIVLIVLASFALLVVAFAYVCFRLVFYSAARKPLPEGEYDIPEGDIYEEFREDMVNWQKALTETKCKTFEITSRDGLALIGRYYEYAPGAPLEIMFHGYRGNAVRDLSGGVERCFNLQRNTLIVSQRAHGDSDGHVITFGYYEKYDCLDWVNFAVHHFGDDQKIILTGISMGAATVLMASGEKLPDNVVCILADCGYSSTRGIIRKVLKDIHLPAPIVYPFIRLGGILFAGFDPNKCNPIEAVKKTKVPIIFIHGDTDDFVPHQMSREMYDVCPTEKAIYICEGAGHGLAFPKDQQKYYAAVRDFEKVWNK